MQVRSIDHPEANGRKPQFGDVAWVIKVAMENGEFLELEVGKKAMDMIFGMLIADCVEHKEPEPA